MGDIKEIFEKLDIAWDVGKEEKLLRYMDEILRLNEQINLTAIKDREEFLQKHYLDSLLCVGSDEFKKARRIIDVGTGAGFPGVPLAVAFPEKEFLLVDSLNKRVKIVAEICESLSIDNVCVLHGRAEELARRKDLREAFDLCVSRAVANMSTLTEYCLPFVKVGGAFIAYKGPDCGEELAAAAKAIETLGGSLSGTEQPGESKGDEIPFRHTLVFIKKENPTGSKYPRKAGIPSKEPVK
ncbi:MAG: 16S rRNA (guanine(527)-N(7))-methyltransferase RsmG [Bacillota bacterium]|nr:16S rRNA (guanine(527)-N(7))-methyltransferase RsmG [Bacillota bacterium]